jgi:hypothetical protein
MRVMNAEEFEPPRFLDARQSILLTNKLHNPRIRSAGR